MFGNLLKAAVAFVVETPIAIIADVATLGGAITDTDKPYTEAALKKVFDNVRDSTK